MTGGSKQMGVRRVDEQLQLLRMGAPVVIKVSAGKLLGSLLISLGFTVLLGAGLFYAWTAEDATTATRVGWSVLGGVGVLFFGVIGIPVLLLQLWRQLQRPGRFVVTNQGFWMENPNGTAGFGGLSMMPWTGVERVDEVVTGRFGTNKMIRVQPRPQPYTEGVAAMNGLGRWLHRADRAVGIGKTFIVPTTLIGRHRDRLALMVRAHAEFGGPGRGLGQVPSPSPGPSPNPGPMYRA